MDKIVNYAVIARFLGGLICSVFRSLCREIGVRTVYKGIFAFEFPLLLVTVTGYSNNCSPWEHISGRFMRFNKGLVYLTAAALVAFVGAAVVVYVANRPAVETVVSETAKSGLLKLGVERSLAAAAGDVAPVFSHYYPDASIELETGLFADLFSRFLRRELRAMLLSGDLGTREISLLKREEMAYRLEPVARGAVVCIVNAANPVQSLCVEELAEIFTARKARWSDSSADGGEIKAYLNNNDVRLQQQFLAMAAPEQSHLTAWHAGSDRELARLVSMEKNAVGIIPLSRVGSLVTSGPASSALRVVPVCRQNGDIPVMPSQYNVYQGKYPLGYIVYYMYRKNEALAAGFGAWLAKEGQKGFVQSSLAPYKQPVRVINLN